jgi:hypothetical protein
MEDCSVGGDRYELLSFTLILSTFERDPRMQLEQGPRIAGIALSARLEHYATSNRLMGLHVDTKL